MFKRIGYLRSRFHDAHRVFDGARHAICDRTGRQVGFVDRLRYEGGALRATGWVSGVQEVSLRFAGVTRTMVPDLMRKDVAAGDDGKVGFDLSVTCSVARLSSEAAPGLVFDVRGDSPSIEPVSLPLRDAFAGRFRTDLWLGWRMLRAAPKAFRWMRTRSTPDRAAVLDALLIAPDAPPDVLKGDLFSGASHKAAADTQVTIIVPVFDGFGMLTDCLNCVVRHTDVPFRLILVDDASPDARVRLFLRGVADRHANIDLIENEENLGFIGSVNAALRMACDSARVLPDGVTDGPVILLNTDAFVPAGWVSRLIAPLLADETVASATPLSNDAEILSVPAMCKASPMTPDVASAIDRLAATLNPDVAWAAVPTGVGFCMAMSRTWLAAVPQLDRVFGRGYGEEVDWCQRVQAKGGVHIGVANLFVEHRGGASFGAQTKAELVARNGGIISRRYPHFDRDVQAFIAADPLRSPRLALALAWAGAAARSNVQVYLAHSLGGGAEDYLKARMLDDLAGIGAAIVVRVGGRHHWRIEVHSPYGMVMGDTDDEALVKQLIGCVGAFDVVYSCGVGAAEPLQVPEVLLDLHQRGGGQLSVLVHDFFVLSPSYTLLGTDGRYGGPDLSGTTDPAHIWKADDARTIGVEDWQARWRRLLDCADRIDVFSEDSRAIITAVWPDLTEKINVCPHAVADDVVPVSHAPESEVLGVLGGINLAKGASVVAAFAAQNPTRKIVVIGKVDPAFVMPPNVTVHGAYERRDITALTERYGIGRWLIPSIWPETFSFTTHEALATGLPVMAFELGAQGSVVRAAERGLVVPFDPGHPFDPARLATSVVEHMPHGRA